MSAKTGKIIREQVISYRKSGMILSEIAEKTGISERTVFRILKEAGLTIPRFSGTRHPIWDQKEAGRIYEKWKAGMAVYDIAHEEHKGYMHVRRLLEQGSGKTYEILQQERRDEKDEAVWQKVKEDVRSGKGPASIDKKYGMHNGTTAKLIKKYRSK